MKRLCETCPLVHGDETPSMTECYACQEAEEEKSEATDICKTCGIKSISQLRKSGVDEYDLKTLRSILADEPNKEE